MGRRKARIKMMGTCPNCGEVFIRPAVCTHAVCNCSSIIEIPLHPVLILPDRLHAKIKKISDLSGVSVEDFTSALLLEVLKQKLRGIKEGNLSVN